MSTLDTLLERNKALAAKSASAGSLMPSLPNAMPNVKAVVIGCADMRVDPVDILGIQPGEALVLRNIGGRVTPVLMEELGLLGRIGQVLGQAPAAGGEFHLILLQHTDCGITRLANDPALLQHYFQVPEDQLPAKAVLEPRAAVAFDVAALKAVPAFPAQWLISGLVYDVATGLIETVVPPAPMRPA